MRAASFDLYSHDVSDGWTNFVISVDDRTPTIIRHTRILTDESSVMFVNLQLVTTTTAL